MADTRKLSAPDAPKHSEDAEANARVTSRAEVHNAALEKIEAEKVKAANRLIAAQAAEAERAAKAEVAAAKKAATPTKQGKGGELIRYCGSSDVYEDGPTGLRFVANGTPHDVEPDVADRLLNHSGPFEKFERASAGEN